VRACGYHLLQATDLWDYRGMFSDPRGSGVPIRSAFRPNWVMLVMSLVCAVVFGGIGALVRFLSSCHTGLDGGQNCQDYSLLGVLVGDVLLLPYLLVGWIASLVEGSASDNSDPIRGYGWIVVPLLWTYYYLILALIRAFRSWIEVRNAPPSLK